MNTNIISQSELTELARNAGARARLLLAGYTGISAEGHISGECGIPDCNECARLAHESVASGIY